MKMHILAILLSFTWLAPLVSAVPTGLINDITFDTEVPKVEQEPESPSLGPSSHLNNVQVRDGYLVTSPPPGVDASSENEAQLAERGVTLVKRVESFWYYAPNPICWSCVVQQAARLGIAERYLGRDPQQNPQWTRGTLPVHLMTTLLAALRQCNRLVPDQCESLVTYIDQFGYITTLGHAQWLAYIIAPGIFERRPPGPPPRKE